MGFQNFVVSNKIHPLKKMHIYRDIGTCIFDTACHRQSKETVTLGKHITKYKYMLKWMIEFIRKSENRGDEIGRVNSIRINKFINLL